MFNMFKFLMEEANGDGAGAAGGGSNGGGAGGDAGAAGANTPPNIADGGSNGAGANGQSPLDGAGAAGAGGGDGKSWLETLPDDLKKDPSLALFKSPADLAKAHVNAQKLIGADKVIIPGEKATDAEKAAFFNKLGRPESPEKYELKLADGVTFDPAFEKSLRADAHKLGLSGAQLNGLANWYTGAAKAAQEAAQAAQTTAVKEAIDTYVAKVGGEEKYKARVDEARAAVRALANDDLKKYLVDSGLGSRPEMIEFFAELNKMMSDGKVRDGTGVPFSNEDPVAIQAQITEIEGKMFADMNNPGREAWIQQRNKLYERLSAIRAK